MRCGLQILCLLWLSGSAGERWAGCKCHGSSCASWQHGAMHPPWISRVSTVSTWGRPLPLHWPNWAHPPMPPSRKPDPQLAVVPTYARVVGECPSVQVAEDIARRNFLPPKRA
jgi:hypothetical protein